MHRSPGLVLRVTANGVKSWIFWVVDPGTRQWRKLWIGRFDWNHPDHLSLADARKRVKELAKVTNPFAREHKPLTVTQLGEKYIERHAKPRKRSWTEDERKLKKHVYPKLGKRLVDTVTRGDLADLVARIHERAPIEANRTLALLRKMFKFAVQVGDLEMSPALIIPAPAKEVERSRVLSDDEIKAFWRATDGVHVSGPTRDALRVTLLLGARIGEVCGMRRSELLLDPAIWRLPKERSKTNTDIVRPIPSLALQIIRSRLDEARGDYVFSSPLRALAPIGPRAACRSIHRAQQDDRSEMPDGFSPHDLRRTCRTRLAMLGVSETVAKKILGHVPPRSDVTARVYDQHTYLPEMLTALEKWEQHLTEVIGIGGAS